MNWKPLLNPKCLKVLERVPFDWEFYFRLREQSAFSRQTYAVLVRTLVKYGLLEESFRMFEGIEYMRAIQRPCASLGRIWRFKHQPLETIPKVENGVDYGSESVVLASSPNCRLLWVPSHRRWADQLHPCVYESTKLCVQHVGQSSRHYLHEGGRPSRDLFAQTAAKMKEFFGVPVAPLLVPGKTLTITFG